MVSAVVAGVLVLVLVLVMVMGMVVWVSGLGSYGSSRRRQGVFGVEGWGWLMGWDCGSRLPCV